MLVNRGKNIFLALFIASFAIAGDICLSNIETILFTDYFQKNKKLNLKKAHTQELFELFKYSEDKEAFRLVIQNIRNSGIFSRLSPIKRRSVAKLKAIQIADEHGFQAAPFVNRLIKNEKLSLDEKRALYLIINKNFWYEDAQLSYGSELMKKMSFNALVKGILKRLSILESYPNELGDFVGSIQNDGFYKRLFHKYTYQVKTSSIGHEVAKFHDKTEILENIRKAKFTAGLLIDTTDGLQRRQNIFRLQQLEFIEQFLDKDFSHTIEYSRLMSLLPDSLMSVEKLSYWIAGTLGLTYFIDQKILQYVEDETIDSEVFMNGLSDIEFQQVEEDTINLSIEEELDRKLNSGEISLEDYLKALDALEASEDN